MASYEIVFKRSVAKDLRDIPRTHVNKILARIQALAANPRPPGCEKLSEREWYRIRQGAYRILYEILDELLVVVVVHVGHRRDAYRRTGR